MQSVKEKFIRVTTVLNALLQENKKKKKKSMNTTPAVELKERARASPEARFEAMARSSSAGSDSTFVGTTAAFN